MKDKITVYLISRPIEIGKHTKRTFPTIDTPVSVIHNMDAHKK